jgi:hypothetical protein
VRRSLSIPLILAALAPSSGSAQGAAGRDQLSLGVGIVVIGWGR